jgi:hypothetical protein
MKKIDATPLRPIDLDEDLKKQDAYAKELLDSGFDFGIAVTDTFIRSIRKIGYHNTGTALDEEIDNSVQAGAKNIHILFGYYPENKSQKKIDQIAILDDGHGMNPAMIRAAVVWGGTHRAEDRGGFGRFGFGLPSSCVSQGLRFKVYSKTAGGQWHSVVVDVDQLAEEFKAKKKMVVPQPIKENPPSWVMEYAKANKENVAESLQNGTVVIIDKLDKVDFKTTQALREFLLQHFGLVYRWYLREVSIFVEGTSVEPLDPLFITPGFRMYDRYTMKIDGKMQEILDPDRAEVVEGTEFEVKDKETGEPLGVVKVRLSYMPPTFARIPAAKKMERGTTNPRYEVMDENNGIVIMRNGRQIDVVKSKCPWFKFQNNDAYIGIEIDFPPTLDDEFSITTHKQQVGLSNRMWDLLRDANVKRAIFSLRVRNAEDRSRLKAERESFEKKPSEQAMEDAQKFRRAPATAGERKREGDERLRQEAHTKAEQTGRPVEKVHSELEQEIKGFPYRVLLESRPEGAFYRPEPYGTQLRIYINTAHRFFKEVYSGKESTPHLRNGLETLLFVLGDCESSAKDGIRSLYESERAEWSRYVNIVLDRLGKWNNRDDESASDEEMAQNGDAETSPTSSASEAVPQ